MHTAASVYDDVFMYVCVCLCISMYEKTRRCSLASGYFFGKPGSFGRLFNPRVRKQSDVWWLSQTVVGNMAVLENRNTRM